MKKKIEQIEKGRNTVGYENYLRLVPKEQRTKDQILHPVTPDPYEVCSRRNFQGKMKAWRRRLHYYDPETYDPTKMPEDKLRKAALRGSEDAKKELTKRGVKLDGTDEQQAASAESSLTAASNSGARNTPSPIPHTTATTTSFAQISPSISAKVRADDEARARDALLVPKFESDPLL